MLIDRRRQPAYQLGGDGHEGTQGKAHPDDLHGPAIAIDLRQQVVDDVRNREDDDSAGKLQRELSHLPETGDKEVGGYQAHTEGDSQPDESDGQPLLSGFVVFRHFLLVFRVVPSTLAAGLSRYSAAKIRQNL